MSNSYLQLRPIPNFPGYSITETGKVWSEKSQMWLKSYLNNSTHYWEISLYHNKRVHPIHIHRLVLETFIGPCPEGMEAHHKDAIRANNRLDNLEWLTRFENLRRRKRYSR